MYHGVHVTSDGPIYRAGLALLDLEDPRIVLRRTDEWVFGPAEPYELNGRRRAGRVPVRLGPRPGDRQAAPLLRRRGHGDRPRVRQAQRRPRAVKASPVPPLPVPGWGFGSPVSVE